MPPPKTGTPLGVPFSGNFPPLFRGSEFSFQFGQSNANTDVNDQDLSGKLIQVVIDSPLGVRTEWRSDDPDGSPFTYLPVDGPNDTVYENAIAVLDTGTSWSSSLTEEGTYHVTVFIDKFRQGYYLMRVFTTPAGELDQ